MLVEKFPQVGCCGLAFGACGCDGADMVPSSDLVLQAATPGALRRVVLEAWQRTRLDWTFGRSGLSSWLRDKRSLGSAERRFVSEVVFGMVRHLRRIDEGLQLGGAIPGNPTDSGRLLLYLVLEAGLAPENAAACAQQDGGRRLDWDKAAEVDAVLSAERDPTKRLALLYSLPDWLAREWHSSFGEEAETIARAFGQRAPLTLRVCTRRASRSDMIKELTEAGLECRAGEFCEQAIVLADWPNVHSLRAFKRGDIEVQDEASQLVAELVGALPGELIVDVCAGAGGKTLALADRMDNRGRIVAADMDGGKLKELRRRSRRAQVSSVQCVTLEEDGWSRVLEAAVGTIDRVLIDAPCSGLGAMRRHPEAKWRVQEGDIAQFAHTQFAIASRAASLLAPGGRLVYATCTMLPWENEQVVFKVAKTMGLSVVPIAAVLGKERGVRVGDPDGKFLRMLPHSHGTDGFFAAVLERSI